MRAFGVSVFFATRVLAQSASGVPACAQPCVVQSTSGSTTGSCNSADVACICSNSGFLSNLACCLAGVCSQADQQAAITYTQNVCAANGVTNLPSVVSCSSTGTVGAAGVFKTSESASHVSTSSIRSSTFGPFSFGPAGATSAAHSTTSTGTLPQSTSEPSSATTGRIKNKKPLSAGAKAGIAISAILVASIFLFAFFLFRRGRKGYGPSTPRGGWSTHELPVMDDMGGSEPSRLRNGWPTHEFPVMAEMGIESSIPQAPQCGMGNEPSKLRSGWPIHELPVMAEKGIEPSTLRSSRPTEELQTDEPMHSISRTELAALAKRYKPDESGIAAENPILAVQSKELPTTANDHELEGSPTAELQSPAQAPQQTFSQPFQPLAIEPSVGSYGSKPEGRVAHDALPSRATSEKPLSDGASSSRMDELREKREKIRVEKERLLKLQELDELEAAVQREMLEEERRARGDVSPR
ncbi:hypothetical protein BGZ57DRAFT_934625 [Hyaloscypha finlandica]|nr:hypothetical protein BGZ57DRAFT_934625 [Hyaloscypha finlandica]